MSTVYLRIKQDWLLLAFSAFSLMACSSNLSNPIYANPCEAEGSRDPIISANGRYVAFWSYSNNLVSGDINGLPDVFVHDLQTHTNTLISVDPIGAQARRAHNPSISADGRYVAFESYPDNLSGNADKTTYTSIFVLDLQTNTAIPISVGLGGTEANGDSFSPAISGDGRYVAFRSDATNLVSGDSNGAADVFVHDLQTHTNTLISVASDSTLANKDAYYDDEPAISADGRYIVFASFADNLVSGDTNGEKDIFMHDLQTHTTIRVSIASDGSEANDLSVSPAISADGRYVAFVSYADNLVSGDTNNYNDIFVRDLQTDTTTLISVDSNGGQTNMWSYSPFISTDGRYVAFTSLADNLSGDTNDYNDIVVRDLQAHTTTIISVNSSGIQANWDTGEASISADGRYVAFLSSADNLVSGDANICAEIFVRDLQNGITILISVASQGQTP